MIELDEEDLEKLAKVINDGIRKGLFEFRFVAGEPAIRYVKRIVDVELTDAQRSASHDIFALLEKGK
jgi:hypothetical protein